MSMSRRCDHWDGGGYCHASERVRLFLTGPRCPAHTPAAAAGRSEPGQSGGPVRVLVTGSRDWWHRESVWSVLDRLHTEHGVRLRIMHGACPTGADVLADTWATDHRVPVQRYPAHWTRDGRKAGPLRNAAMVASRPTLVVAFIRNNSPGATGCAAMAQAAGIEVRRHYWPDRQTREGQTGPLKRAHFESSGLRPRHRYADHIERYTAQGWPVFVLGRSKRPMGNCPACRDTGADHNPGDCGHLICHGFHAATTDPGRVAAMLRLIPGGLLAIRTGAVSGLTVIDIDPRNGGQLDRDLMVPTATVATAGGGWHLYYRHPGGTLAGKLADRPGVDIKSDGGYVVAPPSTPAGTTHSYRWVNDQAVNEMTPPLIAACRPTPAPHAPPVATPRPTGGQGISSPTALLAAHLHAVATAPEGRRRTTLYGAARGVARMAAAGAITTEQAFAVLADAGRRAQQTERDINAAIRGGFRDEGVAA